MEVGFGGEMKIGELISYIPFYSWPRSPFWFFICLDIYWNSKLFFEATDKYFIHWPKNGERELMRFKCLLSDYKWGKLFFFFFFHRKGKGVEDVIGDGSLSSPWFMERGDDFLEWGLCLFSALLWSFGV